MKNKGLIIGPLSIVIFVIILAFMYQWIGEVPSDAFISHELPEMNLVNAKTPQFKNGTNPNLKQSLPLQEGHLVNNPSYPIGIGNQSFQFINNLTPFSASIGGQQKRNNRLINNSQKIPAGIGNAQIKLINQVQNSVYLGLDLKEMTETLSRELKIPPNTGVYIKSVLPDSPADKAGLKTGDVILKCAHKSVNSTEQISLIINTKNPNDVIKIHYIRNIRKKSLHVKLEKLPNGIIPVAAKLMKPPVWMGADIQDIDAIMKTQFKLKDSKGVIVSHVSNNSPAQKAGIITGDVIRRFNGTRIRDVAQLQSLILKGQPGQQVNLNIQRKNDFISIQILLGQKSQIHKNNPFIGPADIAIEGTWIGMDVTELDPIDGAAFGLPSGTKGILVNDVESPPALTLGFQTGDLIVAINGTDTPDMKTFLNASKHLNSAVVDVIRGNKHLFISVPPPGYTRQGTKIKSNLNNFKKVAMQKPISGIIAILTSGPDLNSSISHNIQNSPYVILVDLDKNLYAALDQNSGNNLSNLCVKYRVIAVISNNISNISLNKLSAMNVTIYNGVVGSARDAIKMYKQSLLIAINRK